MAGVGTSPSTIPGIHGAGARHGIGDPHGGLRGVGVPLGDGDHPGAGARRGVGVRHGLARRDPEPLGVLMGIDL